MRFLIALAVAVFLVSTLRPDSAGDQTARVQEQMMTQVPQKPAAVDPAHERMGVPSATPVPQGHALVQMRIPRFGARWEWAAVEGVAESDIALGPGHYPRTPLPGEKGNVAFAGHRAGHGDPFIDFDLLRPGDEIFFSQGKARWTYVVTTTPRIIDVAERWVLDPLPGSQLTLTTCWPKYGSSKRMYVRGKLVSFDDPSAAPLVAVKNPTTR